MIMLCNSANPFIRTTFKTKGAARGTRGLLAFHKLSSTSRRRLTGTITCSSPPEKQVERNDVPQETLPRQPEQQGPQPPPDDQEAALAATYESAKQQMKKFLDPGVADILDELTYEELLNEKALNSFFKRLAASLLGPFLVGLGSNEEPLEFFRDVVQSALLFQLISSGVLFYGCELGAHLDTGEAVRATSGLALGYLSRPFLRLEQILYPVYNLILDRFMPSASYEMPSSTREDVNATINTVGITLALAFIFTQVLFHWSPAEGGQLVVPMMTGWVLFDVSFMVALLYKLRR